MGRNVLLDAAPSFWMVAGPHGGPTVLLAFLLPLLLATSPSVRRYPPFLPWSLLATAGMIGIGGVSAGLEPARTMPPLVLSAIGLAGFAALSRRDPKASLPLAILAGCAFLVSYFSGNRGGPGPMVNLFEGWGFSKAVGETLTIAVRKTIHFTFYGSIGLCALFVARKAGAARTEAIRTAMLIALAIAVCDEMRQAGYANRSGSPVDVLLDLSGAATFVGLSEWWRARTRSTR